MLHWTGEGGGRDEVVVIIISIVVIVQVVIIDVAGSVEVPDFVLLMG